MSDTILASVLRRFGRGMAVAALAATGAAAQEFPSEPIRFILHAGVGGGTDTMARQLAAGLEERFGWDVVVENRSGGSTANQLAVLTRAEPDGHTIGSVTASGIGVWNRTLKQYGVDKVDWVVGVVQEPYFLVVNADAPYNTLAEFVDYAKGNPGDFSVAVTIGRGSSSHIMWEILAEDTGMPANAANIVVFDSMSDSITQLLGNHIDVAIAFSDTSAEQIEAGNLKALAVFARSRVDVLPDVPTAAEAGFDVFAGWQQFRGIIAPKGTPLERRQIIADAVIEVANGEAFQKYLDDAGLAEGFMGPEEFTEFANEQDAVTKKWLNQLGLGG